LGVRNGLWTLGLLAGVLLPSPLAHYYFSLIRKPKEEIVPWTWWVILGILVFVTIVVCAREG